MTVVSCYAGNNRKERKTGGRFFTINHFILHFWKNHVNVSLTQKCK